MLTEAQWKKIAPLLPKPPKQRKGGRWQDLPEKYPHSSTCWRRLKDWDEQGVWLNRLAETTLAATHLGRAPSCGLTRAKTIRVIADKANDIDPLRKRLRLRGIGIVLRRVVRLLANYQMSNRTVSQKIWTVIETVSAVSALGVFLYYMFLGEQFTHTRPREANPSTGRIYPLNNHGYVVYLTNSEQHRLHILVWTAALSFLIAVLIGVFIKKSWRRPKPWETRS